jgi:capsule polysaccharide export protein KpsE/RkpR
MSAKQEVDRMESRLRKSSEALHSFREKQQDIDPSATASPQRRSIRGACSIS